MMNPCSPRANRFSRADFFFSLIYVCPDQKAGFRRPGDSAPQLHTLRQAASVLLPYDKSREEAWWQFMMCSYSTRALVAARLNFLDFRGCLGVGVSSGTSWLENKKRQKEPENEGEMFLTCWSLDARAVYVLQDLEDFCGHVKTVINPPFCDIAQAYGAILMAS